MGNVNIQSILGADAPAERGNYILPGNYKLRCADLIFKATRNSGDAFIAEFVVLESDNPAHPIGSKVTWYQKMNDSAPSAIKAFMLRAVGQQDVDNVPQAVLDQLGQALAALEQKPDLMAGATVQCEANRGKTRAGGPFTFVTFTAWKPAPDWQPNATPAQAVKAQTLPDEGAAAPAVTTAPTQQPAPAAAGAVGPFGGFGG